MSLFKKFALTLTSSFLVGNLWAISDFTSLQDKEAASREIVARMISERSGGKLVLPVNEDPLAYYQEYSPEGTLGAYGLISIQVDENGRASKLYNRGVETTGEAKSVDYPLSEVVHKGAALRTEMMKTVVSVQALNITESPATQIIGKKDEAAFFDTDEKVLLDFKVVKDLKWSGFEYVGVKWDFVFNDELGQWTLISKNTGKPVRSVLLKRANGIKGVKEIGETSKFVDK